jgi:hypothetical protein
MKMRAEGAPEGMDAWQSKRVEPEVAQSGVEQLHGWLDAKSSRQLQRQPACNIKSRIPGHQTIARAEAYGIVTAQAHDGTH